jgi:hypothetical protein
MAIDLDGLEPVVSIDEPTMLKPTEWWVRFNKTFNGFITDVPTFDVAAKYITMQRAHHVFTTIRERNHYYNWAARVTSRTRDSYWFKAAEDVTSWSMVGSAEGLNAWYMDENCEQFLVAGNKHLLESNMNNFGDFVLGRGPVKDENGNSYGHLAGADLDKKMVEIEQKILEKFIVNYKIAFIKQQNANKKDGEAEWNKVVTKINGAFDSKMLMFATPSSNKYAHTKFLEKYGKDAKFDFMNIEHRIFQGNMMAEYHRSEAEKEKSKTKKKDP